MNDIQPASGLKRPRSSSEIKDTEMTRYSPAYTGNPRRIKNFAVRRSIKRLQVKNLRAPNKCTASEMGSFPILVRVDTRSGAVWTVLCQLLNGPFAQRYPPLLPVSTKTAREFSPAVQKEIRDRHDIDGDFVLYSTPSLIAQDAAIDHLRTWEVLNEDINITVERFRLNDEEMIARNCKAVSEDVPMKDDPGAGAEEMRPFVQRTDPMRSVLDSMCRMELHMAETA